MRNNNSIAIVIPCYNVEKHIEKVVAGIPEFVDRVILVDDCSTDGTSRILARLQQGSSRISSLCNATNQGVGGAMITGYKAALEQQVDIVVKLDGDGQMDTSMIERLVDKMGPDIGYVKANRLYDRKNLAKMPKLRRIGNVGIGFMIKAASGYWSVTDPVNGFFAIRSSILAQIDFSRLAKRYFFESSLLIELFYTGARIKEVSMPAIYADETSHLSIGKTLFQFPPKLFCAWIRRLWLCYFVYDFNICSLYILVGLPSFLFGLIFGICQWVHYASMNCPSPTGTIMVAVLTFILGFQMLLSATQYDITSPNPFDKD